MISGLLVIASSVIRWAATKALLIALITVTFPILMHNFAFWIFDVFMQFVSANLPDEGGVPSAVLSFTGLSAWFAIKFKFLECFSVMMTGLSIRAVLNFIPFVG